MEKNNRKRLAEAILPEFELLHAVSKGSQSETTASARSSMKSEKAVQDWINNSLAENALAAKNALALQNARSYRMH